MTNENLPYLHGFSKEEQDRLRQQAYFLEHMLYQTVDFSDAKEIIEVGCGVGAQTEIMLRRFPNMQITGIDQNDQQLATAKSHLASFPYFKDRYQILKMDAKDLDFKAKSFDGAYVCFVLEHIPDPGQVLSEIRRVLKPGSTVYIHEVMNNTFFLDPYSPNMWKYWMVFNDYQYDHAGDPFIGAKLGNLLSQAGFHEVETQVKTMHFDHRHPEKRKETIDFWNELILSASDLLEREKLIEPELTEKVRKELKAVAKNPNAVFYFSFMFAKAKV